MRNVPKQFLLSLLFTLPLILGFPGTVSAATLSVTCSTLSGPTELSGSINCNQFNNALGTLTKIDLTINGSSSGSMTLINNTNASQNASATSTQFFLNSPLAGFLLFPSPLFTASYSTGLVSLPAGTSQTFSPLNSGLKQTTGTDMTTFAAYTAQGTFGINIAP